jgi:hypothetical protein
MTNPTVLMLVPISSFNLMQFMPSAIEKGFLVIVYDFILQLYKRKYNITESRTLQQIEKEVPEPTSNKTPSQEKSSSLITLGPTFDLINEKWSETTADEDITENDKEVLAYLSHRIFDFITNYQKTALLQDNETNSNNEEEKIITSEERALLLPAEFNPLLEFVKAVCYLLSLKKTLQNRVITLKRVFHQCEIPFCHC